MIENNSVDPSPEDEINDANDINDDINDEMNNMDISDESIEDIIIDELDIYIDEPLELTEDKFENIEDSTEDELILSKHQIQGKHSLKYDSIFKGKKEDPLTDEEFETTSTYFNENFEVDKGSIYWFESIDNENYIKEKRIKEKVYDVLVSNTDLNFINNRRKPSKADFNNYYFILKNNLKDESFTNTEIFNELAVYFSDNLFNMFKLLDNKWRNLIITELQEHIGKYKSIPEILVRNIHLGTEVEFEWYDELTDTIKIITGVVKEVDIDIEATFTVDSYEKIYFLTIGHITKILNNTKFKYNLNKLNNIDFL